MKTAASPGHSAQRDGVRRSVGEPGPDRALEDLGRRLGEADDPGTVAPVLDYAVAQPPQAQPGASPVAVDSPAAHARRTAGSRTPGAGAGKVNRLPASGCSAS